MPTPRRPIRHRLSVATLAWLTAWLTAGGPTTHARSGATDFVTFTDVTASSGISFQHVAGMTGRKHIAETMGSGAAFLDYDGDGDLDA